MKDARPQVNHGPRRLLLGLAALVVVVGVCALAPVGAQDGSVAVLTVVDRVVTAGGAAAAYLVAGVGFGRILRPLFAGARDELALQVGGGLALLLWLSHLLAWVGAFGGVAGPFVAAGVVGVGCLLSAQQIFKTLRGGGWEPSVSPIGLVSCAAFAVMLVGACNPPGALWGSEFGGYDVLEYHLELPQEWLVAGRLSPVQHNVYSFLPSYLEAAYMHVGAMTFAPLRGTETSPGMGLVAGEGYRLISCQLLHVGFAVVAAWLVGRAVASLGASRRGGALATALVLATPWTVVVGSMAYNEMALVGLFAAALIAAWDVRLPAWRRGVLAGFLVGVASSVKPTGLLFCGVPVGVVLIGLRPREVLKLVLPGCAAGLVAIAPWLVRNWMASGNPVFPFAASWLGMGHWTSEQVARYAGAHQFVGSVGERLRILVSADRGVFNRQWGALFPFAVVAVGWCGWALRKTARGDAGAPSTPTGCEDKEEEKREGRVPGVQSHPWQQAAAPTGQRATEAGEAQDCIGAVRVVFLLAVGLGCQVLLWLFTTHLQSRFLMPLIVPACVLCGVAGGGVGSGGVRAPTLSSWTCTALLALAPLFQLGQTVEVFLHQRAEKPGEIGRPNQFLIAGPALRTGQLVREMPRQEAEAFIREASPEMYVNLAVPRGAKVCLLGDATPLYFTRPVLYNTTYDTWPVSGDPAGWASQLREKGVEYVLVNLSEIRRLERSGWTPPGISETVVEGWMLKHTVLVKDWGGLGVVLVRVEEPVRRGSLR